MKKLKMNNSEDSIDAELATLDKLLSLNLAVSLQG